MKKNKKPTLPNAPKGIANAFLLAFFLIFLLSLMASPARSQSWSTTSVIVMQGWDYELGDESRTILTFEHADGWRYGDNFFFFDATNAESGGTNVYGEFHPRLSFSKISGRDLSFGIFKDFLLAGEMEMGEDIWNYLYGAGLDFNLPGFDYAFVNVYVRDNPDLSGRTYQVTPVWAFPFKLAGLDFMFEGFGDFAGAESGSAANIMLQPRLLLDVGALWNKPGRISAGLEYMYWHNKFGVEGVTESAPQIMLKASF